MVQPYPLTDWVDWQVMAVLREPKGVGRLFGGRVGEERRRSRPEVGIWRHGLICRVEPMPGRTPGRV